MLNKVYNFFTGFAQQSIHYSRKWVPRAKLRNEPIFSGAQCVHYQRLRSCPSIRGNGKQISQFVWSCSEAIANETSNRTSHETNKETNERKKVNKWQTHKRELIEDREATHLFAFQNRYDFHFCFFSSPPTFFAPASPTPFDECWGGDARVYGAPVAVCVCLTVISVATFATNYLILTLGKVFNFITFLKSLLKPLDLHIGDTPESRSNIQEGQIF